MSPWFIEGFEYKQGNVFVTIQHAESGQRFLLRLTADCVHEIIEQKKFHSMELEPNQSEIAEPKET